MRVDPAVLAHAGLTSRPQRPDGAAARGAVPADEATAQTTVTAAEETLAGQTSKTQSEDRAERFAAVLANPGQGRRVGIHRQLDSTPPPPPGRAEIAALQQELGLQTPAPADEGAEADQTNQVADGFAATLAASQAETASAVEETETDESSADEEAVAPDVEGTIDPNNLEDVKGLPEIRLGGGSVPGGTAALLNLIANYQSPFASASTTASTQA